MGGPETPMKAPTTQQWACIGSLVEHRATAR